ncbi:hypothetical protein VCHC44C1_0320A, partial [Vibrio cholerae HC-44C1]
MAWCEIPPPDLPLEGGGVRAIS